MKRNWQKYQSRRAPRYTSYPSALCFTDAVGPDRYARALASIGLYEPVALYVHIPFCRQLCWYCGCNMRVENRYERAVGYVQALTDEIRIIGGLLGGRGRPTTVHFGGGTPNFLGPEDLALILDAIEMEAGLTDDARLGIELDPRLVAEGDIASLAALGFSRMSLGVQDFDAEVQAAINRIQSFEMIENCVGLMREAGVNDVSFDLLYGLPRQTLNSFAETIGKTIALAPDRIAIFGYAHLPEALPRQRLIDSEDLPDASMRADLAALSDEMLVSAGYRRVGFDHYAKPDNPLAVAMREGRLRRNFQGFTDDIAETTIGLGASAVSFINGVYAQNHKDLRDYHAALAARRLPTAKGVVQTFADKACAAAVADLLCRFQADLSGLFACVSGEEKDRIIQSLTQLYHDDVIKFSDNIVKINEEARYLCRIVAASIDPRVLIAQRLSQAV